MTLSNASASGHAIGDLAADVHSSGSLLSLNAHSTLVGAQVAMTGQTQLTGDYPTQAKLTITGFDVGKPLTLFAPDTVTASSAIDGVVTLDGPLKSPVRLNGSAVFDNFHVN